MSNEVYSKSPDSLKGNVHVNGMLDKLRSQLNNLTVRDSQGSVVGEVKDLNLAPEGHLNLVVLGLNIPNSSRMFLLSSKLIQKIECATQSLFVNVSREEIEQLPEYELTQPIVQSPSTTGQPTPLSSVSEAPLSETSYQEKDTSFLSADFASAEYSVPPHDVAEEAIRLLEERLVVERSKHKVGEVIVRKEIETRMVEVPVRYEKLVVEQVGAETRQLAEIDLSHGEIRGVELSETTSNESLQTVRGEFDSPDIASKILQAIAHQPSHGCVKVRIEVVLEDSQLQKAYQDLCDRYSSNPEHSR